ncbi:PQQ-dependent sugar dehydrogenase [Vreelandella titanicae]|uniref:PQQ-dependent sugar dehydrogenase n=2 Tax=Oceanospirillales TaxID=135619 RepID=UPI0004B19491|nr:MULTISPECIES: PQQ-dependent sugar dehydrogenase [unclassified Halomonas]
MKFQYFDNRSIAASMRYEMFGRSTLVATAVRFSMIVLMFILLAAIAFVASFSAHAQAPNSTGSPVTGVLPVGTPLEIASGLNMPWSAVPVGHEVLISQRDDGEIVALQPDGALRSAGIVPNVVARGDGGMLGLAVLKEGADVWVYAYHSTASGNRIVRMRYAAGVLADNQIVLDGLPGGRSHNGGRIAFGPDGMLYATVGDTRNPNLPQNPNSLGGKILRMTPTGSIPTDNPIEGSHVYSLGHRNPQGLAWDENGQLWATEFGDDAWDELNRIEPGGNYGWPFVEGRGEQLAYIDPVVQWRTQEMGPSGLTYIDGTFFIAGLTGQRLWSVINDAEGNPVATAHYTGEYGRIRHVFEGSDGNLWFLTNGQRGKPGGQILSVPLAPNARATVARAETPLMDHQTHANALPMTLGTGVVTFDF